MIFGAPEVRQRDPKWIILGAKRRRKTHQEIIRKSVSKKIQGLMPKSYQNDANIGAKYSTKLCKQTAAKHV